MVKYMEDSECILINKKYRGKDYSISIYENSLEVINITDDEVDVLVKSDLDELICNGLIVVEMVRMLEPLDNTYRLLKVLNFYIGRLNIKSLYKELSITCY